MSFLLERLGLWWQRLRSRRKMDRVFSRGEDPFGYGRLPYESARLAAMEEALSSRRWSHALEIGCAEGHFTERLAERAERVTALDISEAALARARRRLAGRPVDLRNCDARDWDPPASERYDLVVLGDVLYYLDKPLVRAAFERVFIAVRGWLAPRGRLLLAHGFAGPEELEHRRSFRRRFEALGLKLASERVIEGEGPVACLLSVLDHG